MSIIYIPDMREGVLDSLLFSSLHQRLAEIFLGVAVIGTVLQSQLKVRYGLHDAAFIGIPATGTFITQETNHTRTPHPSQKKQQGKSLSWFS